MARLADGLTPFRAARSELSGHHRERIIYALLKSDGRAGFRIHSFLPTVPSDFW
jgi:hypothetical protein